MLREIGTWYFEWGWVITNIVAFPLGCWAGTKGFGTLLWCLAGLLTLGFTMFAFKYC